MDVSVIRCPHCAYQREIPSDRLPSQTTRAKCPRCGGTFFVADGITEVREPVPPPLPEEEPVPVRELSPPVAPVVAASQRPQRERVLAFTFTGSAKEYFGIWIVNTLLRIVTLGIYSPWAKVRTRRYFYAHTLLDNAPFDYLADPLAILKGWLIAMGCFLIYSFGSNLSPVVASLSGLAFFAAMPWVLVRSRIFHCRNSAHRNIRFTFYPHYSDAYAVYAGLPLLTPLTLGILMPFVVFRQKKFLVENSGYGNTPFTFDGTPKQFYGIYLRAIGVLIASIAVAGAALAALGKFRPLIMTGQLPVPPQWFFAAFLVPFLLVYLAVAVYVHTAQTNLILNSTSICGNRFVSTLKFGKMLWIMLSSAIAIPLSLGLLIPWVKVRMTCYRLECLSVAATGDETIFAAGTGEDVPATGEELGDVFGFDFGL